MSGATGFCQAFVNNRMFQLVGCAGYGGYGTAFVFQHESGEKLICKLMASSLGTEDVTDIIQREIMVLKVLTHPNIVQYISSEFEPGPGQQARIYMEHCEGGDLSRADTARLTPEFMWKIFFQLALALAYCHYGLKITKNTDGIPRFEMEKRWKTILHRDIKPTNILLWKENSEVVKLCDFGSSGEALGPDIAGTFTGTAAFRPPEITREKAYWNTKSDIYSLGCTIVSLVSRTLLKNSRHENLYGRALLDDIRAEATSFEDILAIVEKCLDTTTGRNGRERPSSLTLLELTGHHATQKSSADSPCSIKGWKACIDDMISRFGSLDYMSL